MEATEINVVTGRLSAATVQRIERLVGGDPVTEDRILQFIGKRYGAKSLLYLPAHVAAKIGFICFGLKGNLGVPRKVVLTTAFHKLVQLAVG